MAYDSTKPANNSPVSSAELRDQFAGLKTLIDGRTTPEDVQNAIEPATAGNCEGVNCLNLTVSNPPTLGAGAGHRKQGGRNVNVSTPELRAGLLLQLFRRFHYF